MGLGYIDKNAFIIAAACMLDTAPVQMFCALNSKAHIELGAARSTFAFSTPDGWQSTDSMPRWNVIAMAAVQESGGWLVVCLGEGGQAWTFHTLSRQEELGQLPRSHGLTNLVSLGGKLYACGMGRVVFERQGDGRWLDISAPWPSIDEGVVGFLDMAEHPLLGLVAVGWQGEVWTRSPASVWTQIDTPTNANFNAVDVSHDGTVFVVGDDGAMMRGRGAQWEVMDSAVSTPLQDVCCTEGEVLVATDHAVLCLSESGLVPAPGFDTEQPATCLKLSALPGGRVCSVGPGDIFLKTDGSWVRQA